MVWCHASIKIRFGIVFSIGEGFVMDKNKIAALIDADMPPIGPITENVREITKKNASRFRGSVRLSTGRIWTDEEFEARRKIANTKPLP